MHQYIVLMPKTADYTILYTSISCNWLKITLNTFPSIYKCHGWVVEKVKGSDYLLRTGTNKKIVMEARIQLSNTYITQSRSKCASYTIIIYIHIYIYNYNILLTKDRGKKK